MKPHLHLSSTSTSVATDPDAGGVDDDDERDDDDGRSRNGTSLNDRTTRAYPSLTDRTRGETKRNQSETRVAP